MIVTIEQKWVNTKKPHKCWGCAHEFPKNTNMEIVVTIGDGGFMRTYWCEDCAAYYKLIQSDLDEGIYFGDFRGEEEYEKFVKQSKCILEKEWK